MRLCEILSTPYKFEIDYQEDDDTLYTFKTDKRERVSVSFEYWKEPEAYIMEFYRGGQAKLTGGGDALRIFATVIKILNAFIQEKKPKFIAFSASKDEPSRTSLYNRLIRKFLPGSGYIQITGAEGADPEVHKWTKEMEAMIKDAELIVLARKDMIK